MRLAGGRVGENRARGAIVGCRDSGPKKTLPAAWASRAMGEESRASLGRFVHHLSLGSDDAESGERSRDSLGDG